MALAQDGQRKAAILCFQQALVIERGLGDVAEVCLTLENLGDLLMEEGRYDEALSAYEEPLALGAEDLNRAILLGKLAKTHRMLRDYPAALVSQWESARERHHQGEPCAEELLDLARFHGEAGHRWEAKELMKEVGEILLGLGRAKESLAVDKEAQDLGFAKARAPLNLMRCKPGARSH